MATARRASAKNGHMIKGPSPETSRIATREVSPSEAAQQSRPVLLAFRLIFWKGYFAGHRVSGNRLRWRGTDLGPHARPSNVSQASIPPERRAVLGLSDTMVRLSVGIEHIDDLLDDLRQALA